MKTKLGAIAQVTGILSLVASAVAQTSPHVPPVGSGSLEGGVELTSPAPAGVPYYEYFNYSSYAKRSYVPGYTPHPTSLFENPRTYPAAAGRMGNPYYDFAGIPGWYFSSPSGYKSGVQRGSHTSKYFRGELGITDHLRGGYPQGMRVVEDVILPVSDSVEKGGVFIQGGRTDIVIGGDDSSVSNQFPTPAPPVPGPAPKYVPESLEK